MPLYSEDSQLGQDEPRGTVLLRLFLSVLELSYQRLLLKNDCSIYSTLYNNKMNYLDSKEMRGAGKQFIKIRLKNRTTKDTPQKVPWEQQMSSADESKAQEAAAGAGDAKPGGKSSKKESAA